MIDVRVSDLQALIDRQDLQDQELQPTLDSLSLLLKDSNHKVCAKGCMTTATCPASNQNVCWLKVCQKGIQVLQAVIQQYRGASASYSSSFFLNLVRCCPDSHLV